MQLLLLTDHTVRDSRPSCCHSHWSRHKASFSVCSYDFHQNNKPLRRPLSQNKLCTLIWFITLLEISVKTQVDSLRKVQTRPGQKTYSALVLMNLIFLQTWNKAVRITVSNFLCCGHPLVCLLYSRIKFLRAHLLRFTQDTERHRHLLDTRHCLLTVTPKNVYLLAMPNEPDVTYTYSFLPWKSYLEHTSTYHVFTVNLLQEHNNT